MLLAMCHAYPDEPNVIPDIVMTGNLQDGESAEIAGVLYQDNVHILAPIDPVRILVQCSLLSD